MSSLEDVKALHQAVTKEAFELVSSKGNDYNSQQQAGGDTLFNLRVASMLGLVDSPERSVLVRLCDKIMRLVSLTAPGVTPKHESIKDTVLDIVNYSIYVLAFCNEKKEPECDLRKVDKKAAEAFFQRRQQSLDAIERMYMKMDKIGTPTELFGEESITCT